MDEHYDPTVICVKIAGATVFIYWDPDVSIDAHIKKHYHKIYTVSGAIEVLCKHPKLDMDVIKSQVISYLRPSINNGLINTGSTKKKKSCTHQ